YFLVRSQVNEADRVEFNYWYGTVHLPLAIEKLQAEKGWRFWSRSDPSAQGRGPTPPLQAGQQLPFASPQSLRARGPRGPRRRIPPDAACRGGFPAPSGLRCALRTSPP